jgi:hypothetical protein
MTSLFDGTGKWTNIWRRANFTSPAQSTAFDLHVQDNENGCRFLSYGAGVGSRKIKGLWIRRQLLSILMFAWDCTRTEMEQFKMGPAY